MRPTSMNARAVGLLLPLAASMLLACGGDPGEEARAARLEALVTDTEAAQARAEAFGHELDVLRALRAGLGGLPAGQGWVPTSDGGLNVLTLRAYHQWNSTAAGREVPRAVDFDDPQHPLHDVVARAEELRAAGVDYLFVMVPSRFEVYPELLLPELELPADFPGLNPGTFAFQAELARRGVEVVPLLDEFAANRTSPDGQRWLYLRAQPLWTPAGVALAARELGERIRAFPWFQQGPALEGIDFQVDSRALSVTFPPPPELQNLPSLQGEQPPLPIEAVLTRDGLAAHVPDRESPIVLVGDAALGIYEQLGGDLASQLYRQLGLRLDVVSSPNGDAWLTFERRPDPLAGKQLVIEVQSSGFRMPATEHAPLPGE